MRFFTSSGRLVIATHNSGKLREFARLLGGSFGALVTAGELGLPEPEEIGTTFAENALIKAKAAALASQSAALADDSGLCVTALKGDPGLYSARWAGPDKDFASAMKRVHEALGAAQDRSAYFIAVLALALPDGSCEIFEGRVDGHIVWPPRGDKGHGYDPVFVPEGHARTFAEMEEEEKNALSHRGRAIAGLLAWLQNKSEK
jgi:XTP/dITP diphosphohydrolase